MLIWLTHNKVDVFLTASLATNSPLFCGKKWANDGCLQDECKLLPYDLLLKGRKRLKNLSQSLFIVLKHHLIPLISLCLMLVLMGIRERCLKRKRLLNYLMEHILFLFKHLSLIPINTSI